MGSNSFIYTFCTLVLNRLRLDTDTRHAKSKNRNPLSTRTTGEERPYPLRTTDSNLFRWGGSFKLSFVDKEDADRKSLRHNGFRVAAVSFCFVVRLVQGHSARSPPPSRGKITGANEGRHKPRQCVTQPEAQAVHAHGIAQQGGDPHTAHHAVDQRHGQVQLCVP